MTAMPWADRGACRNSPVDFFDMAQEAEAKAICATCPVLHHCLIWAIENDERGIWGGTSDRDRKRIRRRNSTSRSNDPRCGTTAGYATHERRGEEPCDDCRQSRRAYQRSLYTKENAA